MKLSLVLAMAGGLTGSLSAFAADSLPIMVVVMKNTANAKYCSVTDQAGSPCAINQINAEKSCANIHGHLPSVREAALWAQAHGAKIQAPGAQPGGDFSCITVGTATKPELCYNSSGYVAHALDQEVTPLFGLTTDDSGTIGIWTSATVPDDSPDADPKVLSSALVFSPNKGTFTVQSRADGTSYAACVTASAAAPAAPPQPPVASGGACADFGSCDTAKIRVTGDTAAACKSSEDQYSKSCCSTSAWMNEFAGQYGKCVEKAMNHSLDKRLLALKAKDPAQFKKEMALQKSFRAAAIASCGRYATCDGTMYRQMGAGCMGDAWQYRGAQSDAINQHQLELTAQAKPQPQKKLPKEYRDFATGLCQLPAEVWKGGSAPNDCVKLALASLPYEEDDPCE